MAYGPIKTASIYNIDISGASYVEAIDLIEQEYNRRVQKWQKK